VFCIGLLGGKHMRLEAVQLTIYYSELIAVFVVEQATESLALHAVLHLIRNHQLAILEVLGCLVVEPSMHHCQHRLVGPSMNMQGTKVCRLMVTDYFLTAL
jgi:hypothetical protein